jgi:hypothetical protein
MLQFRAFLIVSPHQLLAILVSQIMKITPPKKKKNFQQPHQNSDFGLVSSTIDSPNENYTYITILSPSLLFEKS